MPPTPHADSALSGIPDGSQIDAFADALWLEEGLARNTLDAYRRDLIALVHWLAPHGKGLLQVQEADLQAYFAYRHAQTRATTANRRLTVFKRFFGWALRERLVAQDPTLRLQAARQPLRVPKTLSQAQVEALLAAPDVGTPLGLRDRAMLELMYASGLRVSELVALKTWHLRVVTLDGQPVGQWRALLRYLLAWLWFLPALVSAWAMEIHSGGALSAIVLGGMVAYAMLAKLHPQQLLLHEALSGTRVVNQFPTPR